MYFIHSASCAFIERSDKLPLRGSMNYTQSVYVNTPVRAYESAAVAAHEIPPEGGTKAALCAAWLWRTRQS